MVIEKNNTLYVNDVDIGCYVPYQQILQETVIIQQCSYFNGKYFYTSFEK